MWFPTLLHISAPGCLHSSASPGVGPFSVVSGQRRKEVPLCRLCSHTGEGGSAGMEVPPSAMTPHLEQSHWVSSAHWLPIFAMESNSWKSKGKKSDYVCRDLISAKVFQFSFVISQGHKVVFVLFSFQFYRLSLLAYHRSSLPWLPMYWQFLGKCLRGLCS